MALKLRYYNKTDEDQRQAELDAAIKTKSTKKIDFLLDRKKGEPMTTVVPRVYTMEEDVAKITVQILGNKASVYHRQLSDWRPHLKFEFLNKVKALDELPHLGFAGITKGLIPEADDTRTPWVFYFANFNCRFGQDEDLFIDITPSYGVCFFALALTVGPDGQINGRDRRKRGNGLLFATRDPNEAFLAVSKMRMAQIAWAKSNGK